MFSVVNTAALWGMEGHLVQVETDVSRGLPAWNIVGLGDKTIREATERIRAAIRNSGYDYPLQRITVNLSPAGKPKEGSHFDLPVAVGLLTASGLLKESFTDGCAFIGELSLSGRIRAVNGVLPLVMTCRENGIKKAIVPAENAAEAAMVEGIAVIPARSLQQTVEHLNGSCPVATFTRDEQHMAIEEESDEDFDDIYGQDSAKRALVICAAGLHGLLMVGSPGCGKSMLARRLPGILPPMTYEEQMEVTKIYSVAGLLDSEMPVILKRPFRAPHQNITGPALLGGGRRPVPGEISLAHLGVLFMDEFPEFPRALIDSLRQPLEQGKSVISRESGTAVFPAKVILVAAANPCLCGWAGDPARRCTCTAGQLAAYRNKISGPVMDRIDMNIFLPRVNPEGSKGFLTQAVMKQQVNAARAMQDARYKGSRYRYNSELDVRGIEKYCRMQRDAEEILQAAYRSLFLSMRTYHKTIKLARTIADLEGSEQIERVHITEALQYRHNEDI